MCNFCLNIQMQYMICFFIAALCTYDKLRMKQTYICFTSTYREFRHFREYGNKKQIYNQLILSKKNSEK